MMTEHSTIKSPGDYIREELAARGLTQGDLAKILDRPLPTINRIIQGKHAVMPEMAIALAQVLGETPETWMNREAAYRLSLAGEVSGEIKKRARLYQLAPVKEMEKREWIATTESVDDLEDELKKFFGVESFDEEPHIVAAMRRSGDDSEPLTPSQRAWCFRVRQLGSALLASEYREDRLPQCAKELRKLAAYPQESYKLPGVLARFGIRFVVVEPFTGCAVDGVALWRDGETPIIGMAARFDRVDNFWFTLFHELSHIRHRDAPHVDADLSGECLLDLKSPIERRADEEAADSLIPKKDIDSFVLRVGPLYSKDRIIQFAHRVKIHPGIIVGQLQKRGEIGWSANREMLAKIRHFVVAAATTDGYGNTIDPRNLR